jgi:hypothetical protein
MPYSYSSHPSFKYFLYHTGLGKAIGLHAERARKSKPREMINSPHAFSPLPSFHERQRSLNRRSPSREIEEIEEIEGERDKLYRSKAVEGSGTAPLTANDFKDL